MTGVFTSFSHARRSACPEWIMIILITISLKESLKQNSRKPKIGD